MIPSERADELAELIERQEEKSLTFSPGWKPAHTPESMHFFFSAWKPEAW